MSHTGDTRWAATGQSRRTDAVAAGREAAQAAVRGDDPALLVVFASDAYDLPALLGAIRDVCGGAPLIGCSTAGEISGGGPGDAGVVVTALGGPGFEIRTAKATAASDDLRGAGVQAASALAGLDGAEHRVLLLLTDGLAGDQQEIVRGAHSVAGAGVPLVGGCAGDDLRMQRTRQFFDGEILENAVVAAAIVSDAPLGVGVRHGWRPVGEAMLVTRSEGNRVIELDDEPALDRYLDHLGAPAEVRSDPAAFTRFALTHPLGLQGRGDEAHVRFVGEADFETRSLGCIAAVPQAGLVRVMEGDGDSVLGATDAACADALATLGGADPIALLAFDCIARRAVLGEDGIRDEVDRIARHGGGAPVAGFYSYGEIARTHGASGFHNQTLVILAVA